MKIYLLITLELSLAVLFKIPNAITLKISSDIVLEISKNKNKNTADSAYYAEELLKKFPKKYPNKLLKALPKKTSMEFPKSCQRN